MAEFLNTGNYSDGEYPVNGPSEVAAMNPEEVEDALSRPEQLDLDDAKAIPASEAYNGGEEQPEPRGSRFLLDDMDLDTDEDDDDFHDDDVQDDSSDESNIEDDREYLRAAAREHVETDYPHSMFTSIKVYMLAERYGVLRLQLLARRRFYQSCIRHIEHSDFPKVVTETFGMQDPAAIPLRDILCALIAWRDPIDANFHKTIELVVRAEPALALALAEAGSSHNAGIWEDGE